MSGHRPAAGVDLGGTKIHTVIADARGGVLGEDRRPTEAAAGPHAVIQRIADSVRRAADAARTPLEQIAGVGISSPGPCDPRRGIVTDAPNLAGWHNIPVTELVSAALDLPALLENDANAAAYGEYRFGAGRGLEHIVYVTLGTGVGGGIIIGGRIYEGASGAAGEVGHIIVDDDGPPCNCGGRGCVEAFAAGPAIARAAAQAIEAGRAPVLAELAAGARPTAEQVHQAALQGEAAAREVIERAGYHLGLGLVGVLHCFNPQALILGGGLIALGDLYVGPALATVRERAFAQILSDVRMTTAALGERAGALGAAALVMEGRNR